MTHFSRQGSQAFLGYSGWTMWRAVILSRRGGAWPVGALPRGSRVRRPRPPDRPSAGPSRVRAHRRREHDREHHGCPDPAAGPAPVSRHRSNRTKRGTPWTRPTPARPCRSRWTGGTRARAA